MSASSHSNNLLVLISVFAAGLSFLAAVSLRDITTSTVSYTMQNTVKNEWVRKFFGALVVLILAIVFSLVLNHLKNITEKNVRCSETFEMIKNAQTIEEKKEIKKTFFDPKCKTVAKEVDTLILCYEQPGRIRAEEDKQKRLRIIENYKKRCPKHLIKELEQIHTCRALHEDIEAISREEEGEEPKSVKMRRVMEEYRKKQIVCPREGNMEKYINCAALLEDIKRPGASVAAKQQMFSNFQDKMCYNKDEIQNYLNG
jgi:hypothetical protein